MAVWSGVACFLACVLVAACNGKSNAPKLSQPTSPPMAKTASNEFHYDDPCSLIEPQEVEAAIGAPLGTAPYRASNGRPAADGHDCIYRTGNFQQIRVTVTFKGGAQAYRLNGFARKLAGSASNEDARKAFKMDDGSELAGEWDEASLTAFNCCIFNALRADQLIEIDFTDSDATLRQAAALVDDAFKRIDKPLALDGSANVTAAKAFLATLPKEANACSLVSQADAENILGPLAGAPTAKGTSSCNYPLPAKNGMPRVAELVFNWRLGNAAFRSDAHAGNIAAMAMGGKASPKDEEHLPDAAPGDPWERAGQVQNDFVAIKKGVRVKMNDLYGVDQQQARAMVAAAMSKI